MEFDKKTITGEEFDRIFDEGKEDILQYFDLSTAIRPNKKTQKVNIDIPTWMVLALDKEAERLGIARQDVINVWIDDRLRQQSGAGGV
jgi:hypothetical protein